MSAATLALMIGLNLRAKAMLRTPRAITGVICGYLAAVALGAFHQTAMRVLTGASASSRCRTGSWRCSMFSLDLRAPFCAAALICTLRGMGDVATAQKINDRDWIVCMTTIRRGIVSDGLGTVVAALLGVIGGHAVASANGMANATGVASRWVAFWLGGMLIVFAFFSVVPAALVAMPRAVVGASFLFTAASS